MPSPLSDSVPPGSGCFKSVMKQGERGRESERERERGRERETMGDKDRGTEIARDRKDREIENGWVKEWVGKCVCVLERRERGRERERKRESERERESERGV